MERGKVPKLRDRHGFSAEIREKLCALHTLNNWRGPLAVATDYLVIAAAVWVSQMCMWLLPLSILLIGSRQRGLASLLHDSCHKTLASNRALNDCAGRWLAGLPIFQSQRAYSRSHVFRHHAFLGDPDRDPDYRQYLDSGLFGVRDRLDFTIHIARTFLLLNVPRYLKYLVLNRLSAIKESRVESVELLIVQAAIWTVLYFATGAAGYFIYWILPLLTSFQVIGWLSEVSEHYPQIRTACSSLDMSRNRFPGVLERALIGFHGDNFHLVHHLFVGIPFWHLAEAHHVLLEDPVYRDANERTAGILTASGGKPSIIRSILDDLQGSPRACDEPLVVSACKGRLYEHTAEDG